VTDTLPIHPDDLLFFNEVAAAMRRVAKRYDLSLRSITHFPMPAEGLADRLGDCCSTGDIRLVMRATENGQWVDAPRSPASVWETAAHELAHLRHHNHGHAFQEFFLELRQALANDGEPDHKEKVLDRLVKLQRQRESEAAIGNTAAAEAFAGMINKMLIEHELNPSDIDYARATDRDPVIELPVDLSKYKIKKVQTRVAWQESLARIVAKGNLCTFLLRPRSNHIWFVGTKSHATVAEYMYGILVPAAIAMSEQARRDFRNECRRKCNYEKMDGFPEAYGYREAWINAFVERIAERLEEARKAALAEAEARNVRQSVPGGESTALMRLNGAMVKVQRYIDDKFKGRRGAGALTERYRSNAAGSAAGRAAADRMPIGRRGIDGKKSTRGLL
jgi:hypothetical protein